MSFRQDEARSGAQGTLSSADVIARLDDLLGAGIRPEDALLAFDADGTLWTGDVGVDTFEALLLQNAVRDEAASALRAEAASANLPLSDDPTKQARILYDAFFQGEYDEERAFLMMTWIYAGFSESEMLTFARTVMAGTGLRERIHPEIASILTWAGSRGVARYVVSASPAPAVRAALDHIALPVEGLIAMQPVVVDQRLTPRVSDPVTYGPGKATALRAAEPRKTLLGAFGDSPFDLPLLRAARLAVAVRPKAKLSAQADTCPGLVFLAAPE